jgi:hypothetical protein
MTTLARSPSARPHRHSGASLFGSMAADEPVRTVSAEQTRTLFQLKEAFL